MQRKEVLLRKSKSLASTIAKLPFVPFLFQATNSVASTFGSNGAIGFQAAESAYSPLRKLYSIPLLPQSALLNSLPLNNILVGQIQAFLESFIQLIIPTSPQQLNQITDSQSRLWKNLRINAQRATGMFIYNQAQLVPYMDDNDVLKMNDRRNEYHLHSLQILKDALLHLVTAADRSDIDACLRYMRKGLNALHMLAYLQIPLKPNSRSNRALFKDNNLYNFKKDEVLASLIRPLPRLLGRVIVRITFTSSLLSKADASLVIRMVVDGINHPFTAGQFISLCQKDYYRSLPIIDREVEYSGTERIPFTLIENLNPKLLLPTTIPNVHRLPLEIFREDENRTRATIIGSLQNSAVYTNTNPVLSFATPGSIGMYHEKNDRNGATTSLFWLKQDRLPTEDVNSLHQMKWIQRLNHKFSLFGHVIEGDEILQQLQSGDRIHTVEVEDGVWKLLPPDNQLIM